MKLSRQLIASVILMMGIFVYGCGTDGEEADKNEPIIFADEGWDSVRFHNEIAGIIIEEGYAFDTEQTKGSSAAVWKGLEQGDIDVHMEAWTENLGEIYTDAIDSGEVEKLSVNRSEEHTSELQSRGHLVCRHLLEEKKQNNNDFNDLYYT